MISMYIFSSNQIHIRFFIIEAIYHNHHLTLCSIYFIYQSISYRRDIANFNTKESGSDIGSQSKMASKDTFPMARIFKR